MYRYIPSDHNFTSLLGLCMSVIDFESITKSELRKDMYALVLFLTLLITNIVNTYISRVGA